MRNPASHELLRRYQEGECDAATDIFDRYVARLIALARKRIGEKLNRRVDPEDIVQSAFRSFFVHARNDEYQLRHAGDLWRLLASITLHKLYRQAERHTAAKRSIHCEERVDVQVAATPAPEPSPAEVVGLIEELNLALKDLSTDERVALTARLQGQHINDIAETIKKSERTARRLLASAKAKIEKRLTQPESTHAPPAPAFQHHGPLNYSDYVLEQMLGVGGMGKVYRARKKVTGQVVAIKALHKSRQSDPRAVAKFLQEACILAQLDHPHIVRVEGLGRFPGGGFFIVMQFIDGQDLRARLDAGTLPPRDAIHALKDVANAVAHAHRKGIIHCDLKPANILTNRHGDVFVSDFGFAFLLTGELASMTDAVGGTAGFMAPELLHPSSRPSPASDVYSLGVVLWVLMTRELPEPTFDLDTVPENLRSLATVVAKCVSPDPGHRYRSATDLVRDLDRCLELLT